MIGVNNGDGGLGRGKDEEPNYEDIFGSSDNPNLENLSKLFKAIVGGQFEEGSRHENLHPIHIAKIINYIIYKQGYNTLNLTVRNTSPDPFNISLSTEINFKSK